MSTVKTETTTFNCPQCVYDESIRQRAAEGDTLAQLSLDRRNRDATECRLCAGAGTVTINPQKIADAVVSTRGKNKGQFRASRPKLPEDGGVYGAAYVWRMIRFHSGQDMTMPVMAPDYIGVGWVFRGDDRAIIDTLDKLADEVGGLLFGKMRMMRASAAWGSVLGVEGADKVSAVVESSVGMPMGNGYSIGDAEDSPEAFVEDAMDENGDISTEALARLV